jgi:hypothetical protein
MPTHLLKRSTIAAGLALFLGCVPPNASTRGESSKEPALPSKCSACHPTPERASLDAESFERILQRHINARRVRLAPEEHSAVRAYLVKPVQ